MRSSGPATDPRPGRGAALAELCAAYWYPLYAFVRRKGHDRESAEDLVQGFFAALLEKDSLATIDRAKGRFRSFLVAAISHYLANRHDHERTLKRGRGRAIVPIDVVTAEDRYRNEPAHELTPERLFERRWATTLLDHVLDRLEAEMNAAGKASTFVALKPALLGSPGRLAYAEIATELGCSEGAARAAAHRLRAPYRTLVREEVAARSMTPIRSMRRSAHCSRRSRVSVVRQRSVPDCLFAMPGGRAWRGGKVGVDERGREPRQGTWHRVAPDMIFPKPQKI